MLREFCITKFASINKPVTLQLGRTTLIIGNNGAGKTAICDAISCLFDYRSAFSQRGRFSGDALLQGTVSKNEGLETVIERELKLSEKVVIEDHLRINKMETSDFDSLSSILKVVYIEDRLPNKMKTDQDYTEFCLEYLSGWKGELIQHYFYLLHPFTKIFNSDANRMIEEIKWLPEGKLLVKQWVDKGTQVSTFGDLSDSQRLILLVETALCLGKIFSRFRPTLLLFDSIPTGLDESNLKRLSNRINSVPNPSLQFIFTTWREEVDDILCADHTIRLEKQKYNSIVSSTKIRIPVGILHIEEKIKCYQPGNEDEFINSIILPLLTRMGFSLVSRVQHHGPGELGIDIGPYIGSGFEWRKAFCGAQVKCAKLNASSGNKYNVNALIDEVKKAIHNKFFDMTNATESKLDYVLIFLSQYPSNEALTTFNNAFLGERKVILLNPMRIAELIWKYGVSI
ncbi:MAG TPA: hypothetical protein DD811_09660 [Syntrophomonas sp.]|jgi:ABC-type molybdenum transport system ATPase subunit/photorepair protein PhrA|nr:hypothetical protein [Syntrophomonas sp.]